jgi:hypothetical protein
MPEHRAVADVARVQRRFRLRRARVVEEEVAVLRQRRLRLPLPTIRRYRISFITALRSLS